MKWVLAGLAALAASGAAIGVACSSGHTQFSDDAPSPIAGPLRIDGGPLVTIDAGRAMAPHDAGTDAGAADDLAPFRIIGRYDARDPAGVKLSWPASGIRARFSGSQLSVTLRDTGASEYDVVIDGAPPTLLRLQKGSQSYVVATGMADGEHEVTLTKRTEAFVGTTQVLGFAPASALIGTPASASSRRIEMIGDSMTCGYGVLGANEACSFSPTTESEPAAWGALAAAALDAEHTAIAWSGIGVYRDYPGTTPPDTMPDIYARSIATDPTSIWTPSLFMPDVVVVNLGTNDFAGTPDPASEFEAAYRKFLGTIRAANPDAFIVAATSPMLDGTRHAEQLAAIQSAVAAGDPKMSVLDLAVDQGKNGYGCNYHPNTMTQQQMAAELVAHIRALTNW
jgi:lysophospholipase L1-like esterase